MAFRVQPKRTQWQFMNCLIKIGKVEASEVDKRITEELSGVPLPAFH